MVINLALLFFLLLSILLGLLKPLKIIFPFVYDLLINLVNRKFSIYNSKNLLLLNAKNYKDITFKYKKLNYKNYYASYISFSSNTSNPNDDFKHFLIRTFVAVQLFNNNNVILDNKGNNFVFLNLYLQAVASKFSEVRNLNIINFNSLLLFLTSLDNSIILQKKKKLNEVNLDYKLLTNYSHLFVHIKNVVFYKMQSHWTIRFPVSFVDKLLNLNVINNLNTVFFIRNFRVFNKGRYSRNRQYYRTGVYWCLYVNIIAVVGMYYWFYRFTMNFGYVWWLFYFFFFTVVFSKFVKFNLFNIYNVKSEVILNLKWLGSIINISYNTIINKLRSYNIYLITTQKLSFKVRVISKSLVVLHELNQQILQYLFNINCHKNIHVWAFFKYNYYLPLNWIQRGHKYKFIENIYSIITK